MRGAASRRALSSGSSYTVPDGDPASGSLGRPTDSTATAGSTAKINEAMTTSDTERLTEVKIPVRDVDHAGSPGGAPALATLPAVVLASLLLVASWFDGAFAVRHWAPVAILGLLMVAAAIVAGARSPHGTPVRVALICLWVFAAWTVASALWAESSGRALEGGARTLLYATLFTVPLVSAISARTAARLGAAVATGVALVGGVTLLGLLGDGTGAFLAGRLDDPVGYRNATACLFAVAFWPLIAACAHRAANPFWRAAAFAGAVLMLGLVTLTEARGVLLGLVAGGVVAILLGPDRLRRSWAALLACGALAMVADDVLTPYRAFTDGRPEGATDISTAANALLLVVAIAAPVGLAGALLDGGLRLSGKVREGARTAAAGLLALLVPLALVAVLVAIGNPVTFAGDRIDEFRGLETAAPGETRLTFGGGQRSDIWRVALLELSESPVTGVGEGNYPFRYYEERRTDRNLSTPHSLAFSVVAELGLVGALALLGFLGAVVAAVATRWRGADPTARWIASGLLASATVVLGQSLVDWIWLIPGVEGLAFLLAGLALAALGESDRRVASRHRPRGRPVAIAAGVALAVAAVGTASLYLSDVEVRRSRAADATPAERLHRARAAHSLHRWSVTPLYLEASALEELGRVHEARERLREAVELEPGNFVTLGLLGDLELRSGHRREARRWYGEALERNPLDVGLRRLARGRGT
jgi:O-Antigen ligase